MIITQVEDKVAACLVSVRVDSKNPRKIQEEYPPCNVCGAEWTITPPEDEWDVESAYLQHKPDCEYAKKRMEERMTPKT